MIKNTINVNENGLWCAGILSWLLVIFGDLIRAWRCMTSVKRRQENSYIQKSSVGVIRPPNVYNTL